MSKNNEPSKEDINENNRVDNDTPDNEKKKKIVKITLISVAIFVSLVLSCIVGMELALVGSGRSIVDVMGTYGVKSTVAATDVTSDVSDEEVETTDEESTDEKASDNRKKQSENKKQKTDKKTDKKAEDKKSAKESDNKKNSEKKENSDKPTLPDRDEMIKKKEEMENKGPDAESQSDSSMSANADETENAGNDKDDENSESVIGEEVLLEESDITGAALGDYVDPGLYYPGTFTTVDESYFEDALFIGDSRLQGFGLWSNLPATFYCATGFQLYKYETSKVVQTDEGKVPIFDALPFNAFTKIYIKVGLNEMGWGTEEMFQEKYAEFIAKLRQYEPRAIIYIHGLLPVTAAKSAEGGSHNNSNIAVRNAGLAQFAVSQNAYYLDAGTSVMDEQGCLGADMASDGVHLKSQYIALWKQYLMEHAVVVQ